MDRRHTLIFSLRPHSGNKRKQKVESEGSYSILQPIRKFLTILGLLVAKDTQLFFLGVFLSAKSW